MKRTLTFLMAILVIAACTPQSADNPEQPGHPDNPEQPDDPSKPGDEPQEEPVPDWYTTNYWDRTDREQLGIQGPVKTFRRANVKPFWEFEFDREGHLIYERNYDTWDENPDPSTARYTWTHTYDNQGRRIKSVYAYGDRVSKEITREFNNGDKIVPQSSFFAAQPDATESGWEFPIVDGYKFYKGLSSWVEKSGTDQDVYTYVFDADGKLTVHYSSTNENNPEYAYSTTLQWTYNGNYPHVYESRSEEYHSYRYTAFTWRANGMPATGVFKENVDTRYYEDDVVYDCEWFDNPRLLSVQTQQQRGDNAQSDYFHEYSRIRTYNDHYLPETEVVEMYQRGTFFHYAWHDYVYDKYGNWTRRQEDGEPVGFGDPWTGDYQDRSFTYFE